MTDAIDRLGESLERVRSAVGEVIVGQRAVVDEILLCLVAGGHALLEGVPGTGKTLLVRALAAALALRFSRIQFTPDLLPADLTGVRVAVEDDKGRKHFEFVPGPIFGQLVLADEVNRAPPRTQSALLEAMQEHQVTLAGARHPLEEPFTVLATQNPVEMEGTYPLPEAQLDRFLFKVIVPRPDLATTESILAATTGAARPMPTAVMDAGAVLEARALCREVVIASTLVSRIARVLRRLDPHEDAALPGAREHLAMGPGVRGGQSVVLAAKARALLAGRGHVSGSDLEAVVLPALRHRLVARFTGEFDPDALVREALAAEPA